MAAAHRAPLLVVSGPGGVGKGTVVAALAARRPDIVVSISATTRPPRPQEVDGRHYRFVTREDFDALIDAGALLEWAEFNGHRYGTPAEPVAAARAAGHPVILEIDVQGARQVRNSGIDAELVLIAPPSEAELRARLARRGDDEEAIAARMRIAREELAAAPDFDHVIVNEDVEQAVGDLARILDRTR